MEVLIAGKMRKVTQINQTQLGELLKDAGYEENLFIYGKSGTGKSTRVRQYAKENDLKIAVFSLATEMAEMMGGVPYAVGEYFKRLLDERLAEVIKDEGKGWVIFFDEMNQAIPEVLNACYSICDADPEQRNWAGHSLRYAQIIGAGNLSDGTDGTVYLNELPTPLHNRFTIYELLANSKDTMTYLKARYKNIPQVAKYIDAMLSEDIPPRDIERVLKKFAFNKNPLGVTAVVGEELATKLYNIQKKVKSVDPAQALKACRETYQLFKENGRVRWGGDYIEDEADLLDEFGALLTEEEIKSIVKEAE